jgi:TPR repeat protein
VENGNLAEAQYLIGYLHEQGRGVKQDNAEALNWYRAVADNNDHVNAQYSIAQLYRSGGRGRGVTQNNEIAVEWYSKAANNGHSTVEYDMGICYQDGIGVAPDAHQALEWFRMASNNNCAISENKMGVIYQFGGYGLEIDYKKALLYYNEVLNHGKEKGNADSNLRRMYSKGTDVDQDYTKAVEYFKKASEKGKVWRMLI